MGDLWTTLTTGTSSNLLYSGSTEWSSGTVTVYPAPVIVHSPPLAEDPAKPEDPIAWLRRRVDEMCWKPALA